MESNPVLCDFKAFMEQLTEQIKNKFEADIDNIPEYTQLMLSYDRIYSSMTKCITIENSVCHTYMHSDSKNNYFLDECKQIIYSKACAIPGMPTYKKGINKIEF